MINRQRERNLCALFTTLAAIGLLACAITVQASAAVRKPCDRDCLIDAMNTYLDAMAVTHDKTAVPLAPNARITENGKVIAFGEGLWRRAAAIRYRQIFADPRNAEVGMNGVADEGGLFAIFSIRLRVTDGAVSQVETLVVRSQDAPVFAPQEMSLPDPLYDALVPVEKRDSRAQLVAVANAYYEGLERADGSIVPAAPGCYRVENGVQTQKVPALAFIGHCNAAHKMLGGFIHPVRNRRFPLVDEERGLVWALTVMDVRDPAAAGTKEESSASTNPPRSMLLGELFKIVAGRITRMEVTFLYIPYGSSSGWPDGDSVATSSAR